MPDHERPPAEEEGEPDQGVRRRAYMRRYQKELRQKRKRLELSLSDEDYRRLVRAAKRYRMKLATFAREAMLAHLDGRFILPNPERVAELDLALRRIATDANRIARRAHAQGVGAPLDVEGLNRRLSELEDTVTSALRHPPNLLELVAHCIEEDAAFTNRVASLLSRRAGSDDAAT